MLFRLMNTNDKDCRCKVILMVIGMLEINFRLRCWRIVLASSFVLSAKPSVTRVADPRGNSCGVELNFHSRLRRQKQQWVARVSLQRPHRTMGKCMVTVHVIFFFLFIFAAKFLRPLPHYTWEIGNRCSDSEIAPKVFRNGEI